jgi:lipopolysaccharide/colanic/teichoic acid biosynthesis glycosyltransferase
LSAKPGITGMWQVSGRSDITDFEDVVKLDTEYIKNWSIGRDFRILAKTVQVETEKEKKEKTVRKTGKTRKKNANPTLPCGRKWQMT